MNWLRKNVAAWLVIFFLSIDPVHPSAAAFIYMLAKFGWWVLLA